MLLLFESLRLSEMSRSDYLWFFSSKGFNSIEHIVRFMLPQLQSQHMDNRPRTGERLIDGVALQLHKQVWCYASGRNVRKRITSQQTQLVIIFNSKVFGCVWLFIGIHNNSTSDSQDCQSLYQWVQLTIFYGFIMYNVFTYRFNHLYTSKNALTGCV